MNIKNFDIVINSKNIDIALDSNNQDTVIDSNDIYIYIYSKIYCYKL